MTLQARRRQRSRRLLYGVTAAVSADVLLRGQLVWMKAQGWDVHLVSSPGPAFDRALSREEVCGHALPMEREIAPVRDLVALWRWVILLVRLRPAVLNVGTPKAALLGSLAGLFTRVPRRVYVVRGLRLESTAGWRRRILWITEWITIRCSTDVVAVSPSLRDAMIAEGLASGREIRVIGWGSSNGVDVARLQESVRDSDRGAIRRGLGAADASTLIGYVGRMTRDKGVYDLVEAIRGVEHDVQLVTVGDIEDDALRGMFATLGTHWLPLGWTDEIADVLAAFDLLVLPTYREGMPNVVLEAAALGVPAITTTATGACDSVVDGETGLLVRPGCPDELRGAINSLCFDAVLRTRMGRNAQAHAERNFRPSDVWDGLQRIYMSEA